MDNIKYGEPQANTKVNDEMRCDTLTVTIEQKYAKIAKRNDLYRLITITIYVLLVTVAGSTIYFGFRHVDSQFKLLNSEIGRQQEILNSQKDTIMKIGKLSGVGLAELGEKLKGTDNRLYELFTSAYQLHTQKIQELDESLVKYKEVTNSSLSKNGQDINEIKSEIGGLKSILNQIKSEIENSSTRLQAAKSELQLLLKNTSKLADDKNAELVQSARNDFKNDINRSQQSSKTELLLIKNDFNASLAKNTAEIDKIRGTVDQLAEVIDRVNKTEVKMQEIQKRLSELSKKH